MRDVAPKSLRRYSRGKSGGHRYPRGYLDTVKITLISRHNKPETPGLHTHPVKAKMVWKTAKLPTNKNLGAKVILQSLSRSVRTKDSAVRFRHSAKSRRGELDAQSRRIANKRT